MSTTTTGAGRPRNEDVGPALLGAARALIVERGYDAVSISDIAARAGTGRQTLYRRWPSKAELILDAFTDHARNYVDQPTEESAQANDLENFLRRTFRALNETGPALRSLIAHAQTDAAFCELFRIQFIEPRRASLRTVLERSRTAGQLPTRFDLDTAVSALFGALWYRLLLNEPLDDAYAESLARLIIR